MMNQANKRNEFVPSGREILGVYVVIAVLAIAAALLNL